MPRWRTRVPKQAQRGSHDQRIDAAGHQPQRIKKKSRTGVLTLGVMHGACNEVRWSPYPTNPRPPYQCGITPFFFGGKHSSFFEEKHLLFFWWKHLSLVFLVENTSLFLVETTSLLEGVETTSFFWCGNHLPFFVETPPFFLWKHTIFCGNTPFFVRKHHLFFWVEKHLLFFLGWKTPLVFLVWKTPLVLCFWKHPLFCFGNTLFVFETPFLKPPANLLQTFFKLSSSILAKKKKLFNFLNF